MTIIYDFSNSDLSSRNLQYAGRAGEKRGILLNGEYWFLKFPKNTVGMDNVGGLSYVTSPLSEYIGSQIFKILGYNVHETRLGIFNDGKRTKVVCGCKDFIKDDTNEVLIPYTALRNDTNSILMDRFDESFKTASNLSEILFQIENNTILKTIPNLKEHFWEVAIIDYIINNNDRNEDNWGVIRFKKENINQIAPVYDCGNSFYGKTSEERIKNILSSNERLKSSAINVITAYEDDVGERYSAKKLLNISSPDLKSAKNKIFENFHAHLEEVINLINDIPEEYNGVKIISKERKRYYIETLIIRIETLNNIKEE